MCEKTIERGINIENFQVLAPMYKGLNGIDALNELMANIFNNKNEKYKIGDKYYRINDKVIQLVNDVDNNVFNGDKYIKTDLSNNEELEALLKEIDDLSGKIIFLVNSVGYQENIDVLDISKYDMLKMFETTVFSIFKIEQLVLKKMIKYKPLNKLQELVILQQINLYYRR